MRNMINPISAFKKQRTFRVDILTLFLTLFLISFSTTIWFNYDKQKESTLDLAKKFDQQVSHIIFERLDFFFKNFEYFIEASSVIFNINDSNMEENGPIGRYFYSVVENNPDLTRIYFSTKDGNGFSIDSIKDSGRTNYISDPSKPLPKDARFSVEIFNNSSEPKSANRFYKNAQLETVGTETYPTPYDPIVRPWFVGAVNHHELYWTPIYKFFVDKKLGITVSLPIYNKKKELVAVLAADLTLDVFSQFLSKQSIGENGKAFILNKNGDLIAPTEDPNNALISPKALSEAFAAYQLHQKSNFLFTSNKIDYLAHIQSASFVGEESWLIVIIVPLKDFFSHSILIQKEILLLSLLLLSISVIVISFFSKRISKPIVQLSEEIHRIQQFDLSETKQPKSYIKEILLMQKAIESLKSAIRSFGRYVPHEIVRDLVQRGADITLGGEKKELIVFFSDIGGFTSIAEKYPTEHLMPLLAAYFDGLSKIIIEEQGTIDKYIGDCIMALWGAPKEIRDPESCAARAALRFQIFLSKFNAERRKNQEPEFKTRIGISEGLVIVGNIGTSERMNYTVMGDAVNLAAHLQDLDKIYQTATIISEPVQSKIKDLFVTRPLDLVRVKGKSSAVKIYELFGLYKGDPTLCAKPEEIELCRLFTLAYQLFEEGKSQEAKSAFEEILEKFPHDYPTQFWLERF